MPDWLNLVVQSGAVGALALLIYFLFYIGIPKVLDRFENIENKFLDALKTQDSKFLFELAAQREQFSGDLKEIQRINIESYREHREIIVSAVKENTEATRELQLKLAALRCITT